MPKKKVAKKEIVKKKVERRPEWSKGHETLMKSFVALTRSESFMRDVKRLRRGAGIPENGFDTKDESILRSFQFKKTDLITEQNKEKLITNLDWLTSSHRLGPLGAAQLPLLHFIMFDAAILLPEFYDVCAIQSIKNSGYSQQRFGETLYNDISHPIAIRISSNASKNEIVDYINRNYMDYILPLQILNGGKRAVKTGNLRKRKNDSLLYSDLIWENKDKKLSEIMSILLSAKKELGLKTDFPEMSNIQKILIREKKRRH